MNFDINRYCERSLLPCPICLKRTYINFYEKETIFRKKLYKIKCDGYGCYDTEFVYSFDKNKVIDKWNKRSERIYRKSWHKVKKW